MNTSMSTKKEKEVELSESQTSAVETENNEKSGMMVHVEKIDDSPFSIITNDEGDCFICIGMVRITDKLTWEEAKNKIEEKDWGLIVSLMTVVGIEIGKDKSVIKSQLKEKI